MPPFRPRLVAALLVLAAALLIGVRFSTDPESDRAPAAAARASTTRRSAAPGVNHAPSAAGTSQGEFRSNTLGRLAYAQAWDGPLPTAMAAFRTWTEHYRAAPSLPARLALEPTGVSLARSRRSEMRRLIITDPRRALAVTVPAVVRQTLPVAVLAKLETRHADRGDFALQSSQHAPDTEAGECSLRRTISISNSTYTAHPYGRREPQLTKEGASLHGIALDGECAVHESPLRVLEPGELPERPVESACLVCGRSMLPVATEFGANLNALEFVVVDGRIHRVHEEELESLEHRAERAEDQPGPRVLPLGQAEAAPVGPPRAADAPTAHTIGPKQVLVIRTDFSDFPGDTLSPSAAQSVVDGSVKSFLEDASYGDTTVVATVSSQLYRLPRTGASYATANDNSGLHSDARTAAGADYTLANFDRIIVLFPNISTARIQGSKITYAGLANVAGTNVWINGPSAFVYTTVSHELGHTYGLLHSNLWRVKDGNPVSTDGTTLEYGDPFDMMGSTSVTGITRDARHHYNMWHKNRLGWLPDGAVTTVTRSGTYRIYRFDSRSSPRDRPLALRVFRDGVRWYWIGLRQNFTSGTPRIDGAYVIWAYNQRMQSQLLDLTTPGTSANDASLGIGVTFNDARYGVSIRPLARAGTEPEQWLEVEVTIPSNPPNVVTAWGREGAYFYDTETGEDLVPAPETNVPESLVALQAIAAGDQHALALKTDGTVIAWGNNAMGQTAVPAGLADVVAIAAGGNVSGVVKRDGTVQLWGDASSRIASPPLGLAGVRQLAIGGGRSVGIYHALALKTDGTIVAWGDNTRGQTTLPANLGNVAAVAASDRLSVALRADGTVVRWGTTFTGAVSFPTGLGGVTAIASSGAATHALALKSDGTVVGWGANGSGQAAAPEGLNNVVAIATGALHSLALKSDGTVVAWGSTVSARTTVPAAMPRTIAISCSEQASFALAGTPFRMIDQPIAQTVAVDGSATFRVNAAGSGPLLYQWRKNGVAIPGATASTYTVARSTAGDAGTYDVIVTDAGTSFPSATALLSVNGGSQPGLEVSRIANLSIRTNAGTGAQTLIVGFVVGGANTNGTKPLLVRGVGPTLTAFGVSGVLADPKVELFNSIFIKLVENDDWNGADAGTFAGVGAFALTPGSRDAALYSTAIVPGSYSAQISGNGGTSGVVLAEIYDTTSGSSFIATTPRLVNVSARTTSGTGGDVLIAGFVIAGPSSKTVLVRAIGPSLTQFGVTGVLANPRLELFNSASLRIQENDDWGGGTALVSAFSRVGAFALQTTTQDAALLTTLQPGSYTAQVSGVGGTTGVALVEIYEVP